MSNFAIEVSCASATPVAIGMWRRRRHYPPPLSTMPLAGRTEANERALSPIRVQCRWKRRAWRRRERRVAEEGGDGVVDEK